MIVMSSSLSSEKCPGDFETGRIWSCGVDSAWLEVDGARPRP
jgi:hypothetical protein